MNLQRSEDYLIFGTGAIGSVLGGLLSEAGHSVIFHGRGRHYEKVVNEGLIIDGLWGEYRLPPLAPLGGGGPLEVRNILLCVKAHETAEALEEAYPLVNRDTLIYSMQNGLGNLEAIQASVGRERAVGGRVIFGAEVVEPGRVRVTVYADKVLVGFPRAEEVAPRVAEAASDLDGAGVPTEAVADILPHIWAKALYNCCLNPLGAVMNVNYGRLGESEGTRKFIMAVIEEIYQVARAEKVTLSPDDPDGYYRLLMEVLLPPTASHHSSMLQDLQGGRKTEIEALCGMIVQMGRRHGISTPYNQALTWMVRSMEETGRHRGQEVR
jgi:2-dehydropantoate 2-reductase